MIDLKFGRRIGSSVTYVLATFLKQAIIYTVNPTASRPHEILRYDMLSDIGRGPGLNDIHKLNIINEHLSSYLPFVKMIANSPLSPHSQTCGEVFSDVQKGFCNGVAFVII